ncbi:MAG TPA: hypothetical protein VFS11_03630, partial [Gemmatimonadales bacterium]|nr:hypothetical protein [Gemmatimonadales bacterium]
ARFQEWLAKLNSAAGTAPAGVRDKVRADYESRLSAVMAQLRTHGTAIQQELDRHRSTQAELETRRADAEEMLAEAEIRHAVGEYTEEEWQRLRDDTARTLGDVQGELSRVIVEIDRLAEVQSLIADAPRPAPAAQPAPAPARVEAVPAAEAVAAPVPEAMAMPEPEAPRPAPPIEMLPDPTPDVAAASGTVAAAEPLVEHSPPPPAPPPAAPSAPRFVPRPGSAAEPARAKTPAASEMDELAFLKSVSSDDRKPARPSGETARVSPVVEAAPSAPQPSVKPASSSQQKTLKCGECGTFNRATEWYCERCGAELAAL